VNPKRLKILLLSDTHGHVDDRMLDFARGVDMVWHAGDIGTHEVMDALEKVNPQVIGVYGNIDDHTMRLRYPENQKFRVNGVNVWITHIGGYPPRYNPRVRDAIKSERPDLFICGHSHILKVINDPKISCLHMNPGAVGQHGFHKVRTMLRFEISRGTAQNPGKIENLEVIELGKRGQLR
jgi:putative phosphoesterase